MNHQSGLKERLEIEVTFIICRSGNTLHFGSTKPALAVRNSAEQVPIDTGKFAPSCRGNPFSIRKHGQSGVFYGLYIAYSSTSLKSYLSIVCVKLK